MIKCFTNSLNDCISDSEMWSYYSVMSQCCKQSCHCIQRKLWCWTSKMSLKTYGDRPISFQLEENGEFFCIGSEVFIPWINISLLLILIWMGITFYRWVTICGSSVVPSIKSIRACTGDLLSPKNVKSWQI